ncbi:MAG: UDP-N-acetylmuramyl-tripeptide synthetase [Propionibacteriaceae bacterium]|nr:UDP-N-acetylmuramyl-tripeptide synthetase [Propionibacteriaceae bacterium]
MAGESSTQDLLRPVLPGSDDAADPVISQVTYDSREVRPGALFVCKGIHFSPEYVRQAVSRGAVAYVSETVYPGLGVGCLQVSDIRQALATVGAVYYDHDWDELTLIGVTSTKGKSTTTVFIHSILTAWARALGKPRPGILTSIRYEDGVVDEEATRTTPETLDLYRHLHNGVISSVGSMCVEVSSQALRYKRVANMRFEVGCFLNISEDHISPQEHPDYEDYLNAKLELFNQSRMAVVNARTQDHDRVMEAASKCERVVTFALRGPDDVQADIMGTDIKQVGMIQNFTVRLDGADHRFSIRLPGSFNVENALAAVGAATCLGVPLDSIRAGLDQARVPGRMEVFHLDRGTTVIVDYAHQKLSLETLLAWARHDYPSAPITMVFGLPGEKALNRRQEFAVLAGLNAEEIYLTEDDPGQVPVVDICRQVDRFIQSAGHPPAHIVPDRPEAIVRALDSAPDNGLVLILGKGSERWQYRGVDTVVVPSDTDTVRRYLNQPVDSLTIKSVGRSSRLS